MKPSANNKWVTLLALLAWALIASNGQTQTTASGSGAIAIGTMSGGTFNMGLSAGEMERLFKARGKEQVKLIKELVEKLNQQTHREAFTVSAVQQFLLTIDRKQVPQGQLREALADITRRYLELESRLESIPVTSDKIKALIEQAEAARKLGQFDRAEGLLEQASVQSLRELREAKTRATESAAQAALIKSSQASLILIQLNRSNRFERAAQWLSEAFDLKADVPDSAALWWLFQAGDAHVSRGNLSSARAILDKAHRVAVEQTERHPENARWGGDLWASHIKLGDVLKDLGEHRKAEVHYRKGLLIAFGLAQRDASNLHLQRSLWVSRNRLTNVLLALGEIEKALDQHQELTVTAQRLAKTDPENHLWQRDLLVSHIHLADVLLLLGEREKALGHYRDALAKAQELALRDPENPLWLYDLSISQIKQADLLLSLGEREKVLGHYRDAMTITQKLAQSDPENALWQHGLSVSHIKLADLLLMLGEQHQALAHYQDALAIRQKLVQRDPENTDKQVDLRRFHAQLASVLLTLGKRDQALENYRDGLAIAQTLAQRSPDNNDWQIDWAVSLGLLSIVDRAGLSVTLQRRYLQQGQERLEQLIATQRLSAGQARWAEFWVGLFKADQTASQ